MSDDPLTKKHIISMKTPVYDFQTMKVVGDACKELIRKGGATKAQVKELKDKVIADLCKQ